MALHMLGKSSAEELHPQPVPCLMRSSEVFISEYKNFKSHFMRKYKKLRLVEVLVWWPSFRNLRAFRPGELYFCLVSGSR